MSNTDFVGTPNPQTTQAPAMPQTPTVPVQPMPTLSQQSPQETSVPTDLVQLIQNLQNRVSTVEKDVSAVAKTVGGDLSGFFVKVDKIWKVLEKFFANELSKL
ncbi:MAG: hypothetical protein KGL39_36500 [Patescibacteria group bacterium]|nr:hypothetical protein [Patescibacteria group bacterium]